MRVLDTTTRAPRVLVVDDNENVREVVGSLLELDGFECTEASSGEEALHAVLADPPDLVLLDVSLPGLSGTEVLRALRSEYRTRHIPVILLTAHATVEDRITHFDAGADDYVMKPFDSAELLSRARAVLVRGQLLRGLNPITQLPGNTEITLEIERRLADHASFACLYADLDRFKGYNDHYGFARGDQVIKLLGDSIVVVVEASGAREAFVGHVGGDDFIVLVPPELAEPIARDVTRRFDAGIPLLYDPADRGRGWIEAEDRSGRTQRMPFVSVSIGIVPVPPRRFRSAVALARTAASVKEAAKRTPGSSWIVDRRGRG